MALSLILTVLPGVVLAAGARQPSPPLPARLAATLDERVVPAGELGRTLAGRLQWSAEGVGVTRYSSGDVLVVPRPGHELRLPGRDSRERVRALLEIGGPMGRLGADRSSHLRFEVRPGIGSGRDEVVVTREIGGRPLYGARLRVHVDAEGRLLAAVGRLEGVIRMEAVVPRDRADLMARAQQEVHRLGRAVDRARGVDLPAVEPPAARVTEVAYPLGDRARPALLIGELSAEGGVLRYDVLIDEGSGEILEIVPLTWFAAGRVFTAATPQPSATPGKVPPTPNPPEEVERELVELVGDETASPAGWLDESGFLKGNNVHTREFRDWRGQQTPNPAAVGGGIENVGGAFDFDLDLSGSSDIRLFGDAVATNLFYWNNISHDDFWHLGFTEENGNFQQENFGRGGLDGDPLVAFAQLGAGDPGTSPYASFNAWMSTPRDGNSPTMGMYIWGPFGSRWTDSSLDAEVVIHEFGHGVTGRLGSGWTGPQGGAMNEGNSDLFALLRLTPEGADPHGSYTVGAYSTQDFALGIRTHPYSTSFDVNPLTYGDYGKVVSYGHQVHADGEIWVQAVWELRARLVERYGDTAAREMGMQLLVDTLRLTANLPSMVMARDGLLLADTLRYDGANADLIWEAFSRRGLGATADGGNAYALLVDPDFDGPGPAARLRVVDDNVFVGESVGVVVSDSNRDAAPEVLLVTSAGDEENLLLGASSPVYRGEIPTERGEPVPGDGVLQVLEDEVLTLSVDDPAPGDQEPVLEATALIRPGYQGRADHSGWQPSLAGEQLLSCNDCWANITLPFDFQLFGETQVKAVVSANGLITFGDAFWDASPRTEQLLFIPAIAPYWLDLRTNGSGQEAEGVYASIDSDRVVVRWSGEERASGRPVNVSVSIFADSTMRFDYGPGNQPTEATPIVGLSRGNGRFVQIFDDYSGRADLDRAASLVVSPCAVFGTPQVLPPATATSGRSYNVRIFGEGASLFEIEESTDPDFATSSRWIVGDDRIQRTHLSREATTWYYRVRGIAVCDQTFTSEWSETLATVVEPAPASPPTLDGVGSSTWLVPAAASRPGLTGTSWRTDLYLFNPGFSQARVDLFFLASGEDNATVAGLSLNLPGSEGIELGDVVGEGFARPGASGAILVASNSALQAGSRTFNRRSDGTYGQFVPALPVGSLVEGRDEALLIQLTGDEALRTNIGAANASDAVLELDVQLTRCDGSDLGRRTLTIEPWSHRQLDDVFRDVDAPVLDGHAIVRAASEDARYALYASVVDQRSGDPILILPVEASEEAQVIAAAANADGIGATRWRTDLELFNPGPGLAEVVIDFLPSGDGGAVSSDPISLPEGEGERIHNVLGEEFDRSGSGALVVRPISGRVAASSRTFTESPSGSRGQFVPARSLAAAHLDGDEIVIPFLAQSRVDGVGRRSNVGFVNPGDEPVVIEFELMSGQGTFLSYQEVEVPAQGHIQLDGVLRSLAPGDLEGAWALLRCFTPGARYFGYASVVDNLSGDPVFLPSGR